MNLQWWCSASGQAWTWVWRPYPGVWLAIALLVLGWTRLSHSTDPALAWRRPERLRLALGTLVLWALLDWPVGALAGYLASAHMAQYMGISYIVAPLLLSGLGRAAFRRFQSRRPLWAGLSRLTHPAAAFLLFSAVLVATHMPAIVDRSMTSQAGSFALDLAWLAAALLFWWPVLVPVPRRRGFPAPIGMAYVFLSGLPASAVGSMLTFAERPAYAVYELAPRVGGIDAVADQQVTGLLMWVGGGLVTLLAITVLWFVWSAQEEAEGRRVSQVG